MKQIMVKIKKDENEMTVKYNRMRCCGDNNRDKEDRSKSPKLMILSLQSIHIHSRAPIPM